MVALGIETAEMTGVLASMLSLAWVIAVLKVVLVLPEASDKLRLTGMVEPAATSVPPSVILKVAV